MKKLALLATALTAAAVLFAAPVFADSPGQLSNGDDNYKVKNVTTNGAYGKSVNLTCDQTVKYSILMANSDFGQLENVVVKASLPNNITISGKNANGDTTSVSGSVKVSVPANGTLKYVAGSTNYYVYNSDGTEKSSKTLVDGVATGGVNTGTLAGSTQARVYFQAKVECKTTPPVVEKIKVCELDTKKIITINKSDFDSKKHSKNLADCAEAPKPGEITVCEVETGKVVTIKENEFDNNKHTKDLNKCAETPEVPAELPQTGAAEAVVSIVGLGALIASIGYYVASRRVLG